MTINEKIYELRKKHNLSQEELGAKLNVSRQTVSKWELGESNPESDKIVPLCEIFGISTEELLRNKKIENNNTEVYNENKPDIIKAILICVSVFLYFIGIAFIVLGEGALHLNDELVVSIFLVIIGLATAIIIFACMTRKSKHSSKEAGEKGKNMDPVLKAILKITSTITVLIYLFVSFLTHAWHITWLIWIAYAVVEEIIKLIFSLNGKNVNEGDEEDE